MSRGQGIGSEISERSCRGKKTQQYGGFPPSVLLTVSEVGWLNKKLREEVSHAPLRRHLRLESKGIAGADGGGGGLASSARNRKTGSLAHASLTLALPGLTFTDRGASPGRHAGRRVLEQECACRGSNPTETSEPNGALSGCGAVPPPSGSSAEGSVAAAARRWDLRPRRRSLSSSRSPPPPPPSPSPVVEVVAVVRPSSGSCTARGAWCKG